MSKQLEHGMQCRIVQWTRRQFPTDLIRVEASQNGSLRGSGSKYNPARGQMLKAAGMTPGTPDLMFTGKGGHILFMELKAPGGKLSKVQIAWIAEHLALGFDVQVYSDEEKAMEAVRAFARQCGWQGGES